MTDTTDPVSEAERVLIFAPAGRDGLVAEAILNGYDIETVLSNDIAGLVASLEQSATAVIAEEALLSFDRQSLADWVKRQPPWSDFPFVLMTIRGRAPNANMPVMLGNVTVLERPFHPAVLVSAVASAMRARRRQREVEAHLADRQRTHERQALLIRELHHRVKNTLSTVQGLLGATSRSAETVDGFYKSFSDRIVSLSRTHDLLTEDYWQKASLDQMLRNELEPFDNKTPNRISLVGPPVELSADLAVPTGMAIHELTTNSVKYGALSVPEGRIDVDWNLQSEDGVDRIKISWAERDGPSVVPPDRKGFGSTLIQRVLTMQCDAKVDLKFCPEGLRFKMDAPLVQTRLVPKY